MSASLGHAIHQIRGGHVVTLVQPWYQRFTVLAGLTAASLAQLLRQFSGDLDHADALTVAGCCLMIWGLLVPHCSLRMSLAGISHSPSKAYWGWGEVMDFVVRTHPRGFRTVALRLNSCEDFELQSNFGCYAEELAAYLNDLHRSILEA